MEMIKIGGREFETYSYEEQFDADISADEANHRQKLTFEADKALSYQTQFISFLNNKLMKALESDIELSETKFLPIMIQNWKEILSDFLVDENGVEIDSETFHQNYDSNFEDLYQNFLECNPKLVELLDNLDLVAEETEEEKDQRELKEWEKDWDSILKEKRGYLERKRYYDHLPNGIIDGSLDNKKCLVSERGNEEGTIVIIWDRRKLLKQEFVVQKNSDGKPFIIFANGKIEWL